MFNLGAVWGLFSFIYLWWFKVEGVGCFVFTPPSPEDGGEQDKTPINMTVCVLYIISYKVWHGIFGPEDGQQLITPVSYA